MIFRVTINEFISVWLEAEDIMIKKVFLFKITFKLLNINNHEYLIEIRSKIPKD
jgi:hypothetical protein